jgi:hypothetical protein
MFISALIEHTMMGTEMQSAHLESESPDLKIE